MKCRRAVYSVRKGAISPTAPAFDRHLLHGDPFVIHTRHLDPLIRLNNRSVSSAENPAIIQRLAARPRPHFSSTTADPILGLRPTEHRSAIAGIITPAYAGDAAATTVAPSAENRLIRRENALEDPRRVTTPLSSSAWRSALTSCSLLLEFQDVVDGLTNGFHTGVSSSITKNFIPANHRSALENRPAVSQHISNELRLGRYSGPFEIAQLQHAIGYFRTAPLGVVPKSESDKFRIIQDLSFPRNNISQLSVNSEISSDDFPCEWGTFAQCYFLVAKAPPGTQAATFDVDSAYRNIPIKPVEQNHFCISWDSKVYIDHCAAFGSASSCGVFGRVADAFVAIIKKFGAQQVIKWVDDLIFFRYPTNSTPPYSYSYDSQLMFSTASRLGWPWALHKYHNFANSFTYLGFYWSLSQKIVSIPANKKLKFLARCNAWLPATKKTLRDAQQLFGSLNHCCLVLRYARVHLHYLRSFIAGFPVNSSPFLSRTPNPRVIDDIHWWISTLSAPEVSRKISIPPQPLPLQIFVDASTSWGIGILIDDKWAAFRLTPTALQDDRAIGWAEMVAIELAVLFLTGMYPPSSHFLINSDNQGVIGAIESGMSHGASQNSSLSRLLSCLLSHDSFISTSYIKSKLNPADPLSRGIIPPVRSKLNHKIKIDPSLLSFLDPL